MFYAGTILFGHDGGLWRQAGGTQREACVTVYVHLLHRRLADYQHRCAHWQCAFGTYRLWAHSGHRAGAGLFDPRENTDDVVDDKKGFAAGVAIAAFGLAGLVGNPIIGVLLQNFEVHQAFYILTGLYAVLCLVAYIIIDRPALKPYEAAARTLSLKEVIFKPKFVFLWVVLFINIAAGLALMSHEQQIYIMLGLDENINRALIVLFCTLTAGGGNLVGRLIMASSQDKTNTKHLPYYVMSIASIVVCVIAAVIGGLHFMSSFAIIFVVQFFFGAGFACLPEILNQQYGMKQLATIQGYMLTAWAIAALVGPQIATMILDITPRPLGEASATLNFLYLTLAVMFVVQLGFLLLFARACKKDPPQHETAQVAEATVS